ncbi:class F sortase [Agreia sp.]|uniref:class F sortase n=1 Tax=Agreia sp. TaxID=1872416 RepID=UPI0035BC7903
MVARVTTNRWRPSILAGVAVLTVGGLLAGCTAGAPASDSPTANSNDATRSAEQLGKTFLADWVDDGRVVRRDQGDDTVSEGQAYGMLIAAAVGDEKSFDEIWNWTEDELVRPDGLLSWQWADGAVVDDEPASDADLDAARALVIAGERFERPELTKAGDALGTVILDELTVETSLGRILLPGLWAADAEPYAYNPSYASPVAFAVLGRSSGDPRWAELTEGSRAATTAVLGKSPLPSNWTQVHADGTVDNLAGPSAAATVDSSSTGGVEYGYDAARLPIRYAESCAVQDSALAAQLLPTLARQPQLAAQLDLGGTAVTGDEHPLGYAARAASAAASGDQVAAVADLTTADTLDGTTATYYGAAWSALAGLMLETELLGGCPPIAAGASRVSDPSQGAAGAFQDPQLGSGAGTGAASGGASGAAASGGASGAAASGAASGTAAVSPVRVRIPSIGVDSGLEMLDRDATGWIQPPVDFASAGWYRSGIVPGALGPAVIAGHIDSAVGPAVFYRLPTLKAGDAVEVDLSDGSTARFRVDSQLQVPKNAFPTAEVYGPTPDAQLRLVTCGGAFDDSTGHYVDNVVVFATKIA